MADVMQDKYILGQSVSKVIKFAGDEIRLDLNLIESIKDLIGMEVQGIVTDSKGLPIVGALVKLMTVDYEPMFHSITDNNGFYSLQNIPINLAYKIYSIASRKKLKFGGVINTTLNKKIVINFVLEEDPAMLLGIIAGDVLDSTSNKAIDGAVVSLFYFDSNSNKILKAITYTNEYGQFIFRELPKQQYIVNTNYTGYKNTDIVVNIINDGQIVPLIVNLSKDPKATNGTVSGVISDEGNNPIPRADVVLYKVEVDDRLTPVAFTKTDNDGVYLFNNVPEGTYKIKSNEIKIVKVVTPISPNFDKFTVANATLIQPLIFEVTEGTVQNSALFVNNDAFVAFIGGIGNGRFIINVTGYFVGNYIFKLKYLSGNSDTSLKILIENFETGDMIDSGITYNCPKTNSWNIEDAKYITFILPLVSGINILEFYNDLNVESPLIGEMQVQFYPFSRTFSSVIGDLNNGAEVEPNGTFVGFLGGKNNGFVTMQYQVPFDETYNLSIKYLSADTNRPLKIDVNGINLGAYNVDQTISWSTIDAKSLNVSAQLTKGFNTIKLYNDTGVYGASVGDVTLSERVTHTSYEAKKSLLFNGATIQNGMVSGIAQYRGYMIFRVYVYETQTYDFAIRYTADDDRVCNIEVNEISTQQTYEFPSTGSLNISTAKEVVIQLFFEAGYNTVKIHNEY